MFDPGPSLDGVIEAILDSLDNWGGAIVFGAMFLDCLPFAALVAPGVIMLVLAGFFAASQPPAQAMLLFAAACGGVASADTLMFWIGRTGYWRSRTVRRMVDKRDRLRKEIASQKTAVLIFYQFPVYSRMFAPLIMGALGFSWRRWATLVSASTLVFVSSFFALGLAAGFGGRQVSGAAEAASIISAVFVFALIFWVVRLVLRLIRRPNLKGEAG